MMLKKISVPTLRDRQKSIASRYKQVHTIAAELVWASCSVLCIVLLFCLSASGRESSYGIGQHSAEDVSDASISSMGQSLTRSVDRPTRLIISAIHLDAAVEMVGLKANGDVDTPQEYPLDDVGWYEMGTEPGAQGSAVIDGHLDRPGGSPAVFWYLNRLRAGDDVTVLTSRGRTLHFLVTHVQAYQPQNAPLQAIFGDMSGNYLNLITCAGDWIPAEQQTTQRLVAYTSLVK